MSSTFDIKRKKLKGKSASFKDALNKNIDDIKNGSLDIGNAALIGGGIFIGGYLLYKMIARPNNYEEEVNSKMIVVHSPKQDSFLVKSIKQSIATFLLAIAKQKLLEYLNNKEENSIDK